MEHNALASTALPDSLFPPGHALGRLHRASFDAVRRALAGLYLSAIWIDEDQDARRAGFRPSYSNLYGPGATNVMPFISTWLSSGPGTHERGSVAVFPRGIDRTLIAWAERVGLLGPHVFVDNYREIVSLARDSNRRIYSIDDLGEEHDALSVVPSPLSRWLNSKDDLASVSRFAPRELVRDMFDVTPGDFAEMHRPGRRVFLKTCNTESAGAGVFIARDEGEFRAHLAAIQEQQKKYGLNRTLVIQAEVVGENRSFQLFLDPRARECVQLVALSDQLVEADGKTYKSSVNHAITAARVEPIGAMLLDVVDRVWARFPDAFGFLMCDYFQTDEAPVIIDPGIRPSGNTATALVAHLARKLTGREHFTGLVKVPTNAPGMTFERFAATHGSLCDPESITREGRALLPWGWNDVQGFGMIIAVAPDEPSFRELESGIAETRYA